MTKTPAYHAGFLLGKRDGAQELGARNVAHEKRDFRNGYSDGLAAAGGWQLTW